MENGWTGSRGAGGAALYQAASQYRRSGVNPSINGDHIQGELSDATRWANQYLGVGGYSDHLITDLTHDISDGITLIRLVQSLADGELPKHRPNPMIRVHKLENIQTCLDFLKKEGVQVSRIHADDIVSGNKKTILGLCHALKRHYTAGPSPSPSPKHHHNSRSQYRFNFSSLDKDDVAILSWVGKRVSREVPHYTALYDGRILCELMNEIEEGAIPQEVIFNGSPEHRLQLALKTGQNKFFIGHGLLNIDKISSGSEDAKLRSYLQQCRLVYQQSASLRESRPAMLTRPRKSSKDKPRELVQRSTSSSLESREAARIASRTYEGIRQRMGVESHHLSHDSLPTKPLPHSSKRPMSDIYVSGASSFTDLSTTRTEHKEMVSKYQPPSATQPHMLKHPSADNLDSGAGLGHHGNVDHDIPLGSSWPRQSSGYESDSNSMATGSTLLRSHSHGSIHGDGSGPAHLPYGGMFTHRSLARSIDSVNTPTFDLPGRSSSGGFRRTPSYSRLESGSSSGIMADELGGQLADLEERVGLLARQFLYERHDMFKQIHAALVKERKKRQALERRVKDLETLSRQAVKHYDSRLIELASEVSKLRGEAMAVGRGKSAPAASVTTEIQQLKDQVGKLTEHKNKQQQQQSNGPILQVPKKSMKQSLFMRKRASSDVVVQSNPVSAHRQGRQRGRSIQQNPTVPTPAPPPATNHTHKTHGPYLLGSSTSFKKLSNFFGEEPPRVQNLRSFLEDLGYSELLPVLEGNGITLAELRCMTDGHLAQLGLPFGQRVRLLKEVEQLQPLDGSDII